MHHGYQLFYHLAILVQKTHSKPNDTWKPARLGYLKSGIILNPTNMVILVTPKQKIKLASNLLYLNTKHIITF